DAATDLILQWPDAPPPYRGRRSEPMIRTWHLGKFPYRLIYTVRDGEIFVLAYAHEARRPGYWSHRLTDWSVITSSVSSPRLDGRSVRRSPQNPRSTRMPT